MGTRAMGKTPLRLADFGATHLVGIGGAGMSVIAQLLAARGVAVSGCDRDQSAAVADLVAAGIWVEVGHSAEHIDGIDTLVISTAVRADNPDLVAARAGGVRVLHRSEALAALMAEDRAVAVAGTHGKTTTTAMLAAALHGGGVDASVAIGARLSAGASGAHVGAAPVFIAEADESDGSFLRYHPEIAIVTNLEPDHLDHYGTVGAVTQAFEQFIAGMPEGATLIACADDPGAQALARWAAKHVRVLTYGTTAAANVPIEIAGLTLRLPTDPGALASRAGQELTEIQLQTPGAHNALNAAAAWIAARMLDATAAGAARGLAEFAGAERRFQIRGAPGGITVVDDYAHHPTEVRAVIQGARSYLEEHGNKSGRVIAVLQPHLPSRTRAFAPEFAQSLQQADAALVLDVFLAREDSDPHVSGKTITDHFGAGFAGEYLADTQQLGPRLARIARPGDAVLLLGAGDISHLTPQVIEVLQREYA